MCASNGKTYANQCVLERVSFSYSEASGNLTIPTDRPLALLVTATCHWCTKVNAEQVVVIVNVTVTVIIIIMH